MRALAKKLLRSDTYRRPRLGGPARSRLADVRRSDASNYNFFLDPHLILLELDNIERREEGGREEIAFRRIVTGRCE